MSAADGFGEENLGESIHQGLGGAEVVEEGFLHGGEDEVAAMAVVGQPFLVFGWVGGSWVFEYVQGVVIQDDDAFDSRPPAVELARRGRKGELIRGRQHHCRQIRRKTKKMYFDFSSVKIRSIEFFFDCFEMDDSFHISLRIHSSHF